MTDTSTSDLVQQGLTAARVGDTKEARRLLQQATYDMPDNVDAWLALAGVVDYMEEKRNCFEKVLALDPDNSEAQAGLALVKRKLAESSPITAEAVGTTYCYRHPDVETGLRCNRCGKPICPKCARRTPVGFRCPDCIREQENKFYTGTTKDYIIAIVISLPLSFITAGLFSFILGNFGFWVIFIGIFVAPAVAGFITEAVRWGVSRRRSRYLGRIVAGCFILATLPFVLVSLIGWGGGLLASGIFLVLGTTTILARLR